MGKVVKFRAQGKEYPLSIIDREGRRWVTAQQVGEALGTKRIARLIYELRDLGELKEGTHYSTVTGLNSGVGRPDRLVLSWRGVIRVMMRSQGQRAREFRDWAETVLYQVMTTGSYGEPSSIETAYDRGLQQGLALAAASEEHKVPVKVLAKVCYFRRVGATQEEAGAVCGLSRHKVRRIEQRLRKAGISFKPVHGLQRDKEILEDLDRIILGAAGGRFVLEGGAQ